jgi:hypothetical protein
LDSGNLFHDGLPSAEFLKLRTTLVLTSLRTEAHLQMISQVLRNIFKEHDWAGAGKEVEWAFRRLPKLLEEFNEYVPNDLPYYTPTGHVILHGKIHRRQAILQSTSWQMTKTANLRRLVDTYSPARLRQAGWAMTAGKDALRHLYGEIFSLTADESDGDWVLKEELVAREGRKNSTRYRAEQKPAGDKPETGWYPWIGFKQGQK